MRDPLAPVRSKQPIQGILKWFIAATVAGLLLASGFAGRRQAWLHLRLDGVISAADTLQAAMDESQRTFEPRPGGIPTLVGTGSPGWLPQPQVIAQAQTLRSNLAEFDRSFSRRRLPPSDDLERRLGVATLANSEGRFAEALAILPSDAGTLTNSAKSPLDRLRQRRTYQTRADAHYGLRDWPSALADYQRVNTLNSNLLPVLGRIAECLVAIGKTDEGLLAYDHLASRYVLVGHALLAQGKSDATWHYSRALEIQRKLATQAPQSDYPARLAKTYNHWSISQLLQNKPGAALAPLETAIGIQNHLMVDLGRTNLSAKLALSHANLGIASFLAGNLADAEIHLSQAIGLLPDSADLSPDADPIIRRATWRLYKSHALLGQQKLEAASEGYDTVIQQLRGLAKAPNRIAASQDLAVAYNGRGVVRRALGNPEEAAADFDQALEGLRSLAAAAPGNGTSATLSSESHNEPELRLNIALGFTGRSMDVLSKARIANQASAPPELAVALATVLKNRAHLRLSQGKAREALDDFAAAATTYRTMVDLEGQTELAPQLAKSLVPLAWLHAAHGDAALRNGPQAKALALNACELSDWKSAAALESLAAACAELGEFQDALKWQTRAVELSPPSQKVEGRSRLQLYDSRQPFRMLTNALPML